MPSIRWTAGMHAKWVVSEDSRSWEEKKGFKGMADFETLLVFGCPDQWLFKTQL